MTSFFPWQGSFRRFLVRGLRRQGGASPVLYGVGRSRVRVNERHGYYRFINREVQISA
jgi:hypothetical protein